MLEHLAPQIVNGLMLGAFYAAVAIGLSLIMNLTGVINMAHGSFLTLGGYFAFALVAVGTPFWVALIAAPILTALVGLAIERGLMRPLYGRDPLYSLLLTFGLSLIAEEVYRLIWGSNGVPLSAPASLQGGISLGSFQVPTIQLFTAAVLVIAMAALWLFLNRTRFGLRLRAAVQDTEMIAALGTNTQMLYMVNFWTGHSPGRFGRRARGLATRAKSDRRERSADARVRYRHRRRDGQPARSGRRGPADRHDDQHDDALLPRRQRRLDVRHHGHHPLDPAARTVR